MISAPLLRLRLRLSLPGSSSSSSGDRVVIRCAASSAYEVLGLRAGATAREIKAAYRRLARERHPDVGGGPADFARINTAYAALSDPDARARYEHDLMAPAVARRPGSARPRRTWETDQCW